MDSRGILGGAGAPAALAVVVALAGCGGFIDRQAAASTLKLVESSQVAAGRLGDLELARDAMAAGIVQLEAFALAYPHEPRFAALHADAVCDYGAAFVFDDWEDATLAGRTDDAQRAAERLDGLLADCIALESARLPKGWSPSTLRAGDVPAALAIARARAVQLALAPLSVFAQLPSLRELLERCAALRPGYHDADAEVLLGTLDAALGGGDGRWFARARSLAGEGVLIVDVMRARGVATAHHDPAELETALTAITAADLARWPEHRLGNAIALRKARRYLAHAPAIVGAKHE